MSDPTQPQTSISRIKYFEVGVALVQADVTRYTATVAGA